MRHLIRKRELGPLQQEVYELVTHNLARTNKQVLAWLQVKYDVDRKCANQMLYLLAKRGLIKRVARGIYRPCSV